MDANPKHILSYKIVENIHFDSDKKILVVTITNVINEVEIDGFKETASVIAQRIELAYTHFKTRKNLP